MMKYNLINLNVEEIIDLIDHNKINSSEIEKEIKDIKHIQIKNETIKKIELVNKRISEPLEISLKLYYLFAPFGLIALFQNSKDINLVRFEKYRFFKKIKQYYYFSFIGMISYIILGFILAFIFR